MNRKLIAGIGAAALLCSLGLGQALAATETTGDMPFALMQPFGAKGTAELTDAQKAEMEAMFAQREEKINAFVQTLSSEQKALYDAMNAALPKPADGQKQDKPDETAMAAMKAAREAFEATLTDVQKTAYDELFAKQDRERAELTDEQKAQMETQRAQREAQLNAFLQTLTASQKAAYEALTPQKPADGQQAQKPAETDMADMKAKLEAFVASLTAEQKAAYEALGGFGRGGRMK